MHNSKSYLLLLLLLVASIAFPQYLHIITTSNHDIDANSSISIPEKNILSVSHTFDTTHFQQALKLSLLNAPDSLIPLDSIIRIHRGPEVARIYLTTDSAVTEITSKDTYLTGSFSMSKGFDADSISPLPVSIKGRGNSTWDMPKKPYRLKFDKKIAIGSMKKAKSYVLLANFIDPTLIHNVFAFKLAQLLNLPYTNNFIPADLYLNGIYKGSYLITEKIGLNSGSIHNIDQTQGILYELSDEYDEKWKFRSALDSLPVMIKDPDFDELALADSTFSPQTALAEWQADFNRLESAIKFPDDQTRDLLGQLRGERPEKYIDMDELARWALVYLAIGCGELNHPKSVFIHRASHHDKFHFGPIWDFDWLVDYYGSQENFWHYDYYLLEFWRQENQIFQALFKRQSFIDALENIWQDFHNIYLPQTIEYTLQYADIIEASALRNGILYPLNHPDSYHLMKASTSTFRKNLNQFLQWIALRQQFLLNAPNHGIIEEIIQ